MRRALPPRRMNGVGTMDNRPQIFVLFRPLVTLTGTTLPGDWHCGCQEVHFRIPIAIMAWWQVMAGEETTVELDVA